MHYFCIQKLEIREISIMLFLISRVSQQAGVNYFGYINKLILKLSKEFSSKGTLKLELVTECT